MSRSEEADADAKPAGEAHAPCIVVIEDEATIRRGLCDLLAFHGYRPEGVERGDDGLTRALQPDCDLVLLDIMLPGLDGFEVCERLRGERPDLPILMLTARGSEEDVLRGFRCGSDDYVTKPFSVSEVVARVEALLRRSGRQEADACEGEAMLQDFSFGGWQIDSRNLGAERAGKRLELSRRDVEILNLFRNEAGRIISRRRLLREIWGYPDPERVETRSVDMHIAKLRKKLSRDTARLIETVRGEGYRYSG
jgi:DNA-binding response OmpR family regulator